MQSPAARADALVVMAGSRELRVPTALRRFQEGLVPQILLANDGVRGAWSEKHQRNLYLAEWSRESLIEEGVPPEAIVILPYTASGSMYDARHALDYARAQGLESLLVVTSDYHTRRTLWCFQRAAGAEPLELGVLPAQNGRPEPPTWERRRTLLVEAIKYLWYRLRYPRVTS